MERIVNLHLEKLSEGFYLAIGENEHLCREGWAIKKGGPSSREQDLQKTVLTVK
jgi:hypothetical protein